MFQAQSYAESQWYRWIIQCSLGWVAAIWEFRIVSCIRGLIKLYQVFDKDFWILNAFGRWLQTIQNVQSIATESGKH